jgi:hypothetical protein
MPVNSWKQALQYIVSYCWRRRQPCDPYHCLQTANNMKAAGKANKQALYAELLLGNISLKVDTKKETWSYSSFLSVSLIK